MVDFYIQRNIDPTGLERWWQAKMKLTPGWTPNHLVRVISAAIGTACRYVVPSPRWPSHF